MNDAGNVLLVDDEESFLLSTAALLCRDGYTCDCARDGIAGLGMLRGRPYDVLVADIRMAGNMQLELVRQARELAPGMPVILVTGYPSVETAAMAVGLPVTAYLTKPLDYAELAEQVKRALETSRTRRALSGVHEQLRECVRQLEGLCLGGADKTAAEPVPTVLLRSLAAGLSELVRLRAVLVPEEERPVLCELLDCPQYPRHRDAICDAIEVLKRTKSSFKSKDLAELRARLESLL